MVQPGTKCTATPHLSSLSLTASCSQRRTEMVVSLVGQGTCFECRSYAYGVLKLTLTNVFQQRPNEFEQASKQGKISIPGLTLGL